MSICYLMKLPAVYEKCKPIRYEFVCKVHNNNILCESSSAVCCA